MPTAATCNSSITLVGRSIVGTCAADILFALNMPVLTHIALCTASLFGSGTVATITIANTATNRVD